jgi:excisionase family DNA binding protein
MSGPRRPHRPTHHDPRQTNADHSITNRSTTNRSTTNPSTTDRSTDSLSGEAVLLYTPAEAAQRLRVRESWLRKKAAARQVPCTFLGKHLRFSPADLAAIVAGSAHPAVGRRGRRKPPPGPLSGPPPGPLSTVRDRDLPPRPRRSVHPPDRDDHVCDGSSPWPG